MELQLACEHVYSKWLFDYAQNMLQELSTSDPTTCRTVYAKVS